MKPEILAPVGSMEALNAALAAGCDAVYFGLPSFGARAFANNFDIIDYQTWYYMLLPSFRFLILIKLNN